ncbi:MAG: S-methyl-5-thioribose-1-phosphate isomerase [Theionarchaea archaeon]|nr:S-methyl-5-thioribose-1-phosphate isomerase [Theionarchaea archaeon]MBU6999195.1 S-methyl-5-thioribose-1-phosphate isomerase [Theionarchaea archaeon]
MTIWWDREKKVVKMIDQTCLPDRVEIIECNTWKCIEEAISVLRIRGAPALGAAGAYALALEAQRCEGTEEEFFEKMGEVKEITGIRPTAVNLGWGVNRVLDALREGKGSGVERLKHIALEEAEKIVEEDIRANKMIGEHALKIFKNSKPKDGSIYKILTHCHAGSLATCGYGTVFGVFRAAFRKGIDIHIYADETRPLLQGARITAWELKLEGIPVTLITDDSAGWIMKREGIDMVIVGADRIAANGDTANKIGTYSLSILAKEHEIPFYVAAPMSTIDPQTKNGKDIEIEERDYRETTYMKGLPIAAYLDKKEVINYAFDVTPYKYITGIITEKGIIAHPDKPYLKRGCSE